ncbi:MAG: FHA domain-containing protein [Polyangiaceae bacterium]|nr:FHA domain-containing protein [Polyangiaceae bacterium]
MQRGSPPQNPQNFVPAPPPLFLDYAGKRYAINVQKFIIGRERGACHLLLQDPNVSRQHAAIEFIQGYYYMTDLGSRNGIGYDGHRIHKKQIVEGDKFEISGHALAFSFKNA